jgi:uncharacterized repeat protein (TIGR01451 family)
MATFYNQASLTYGDVTVNSNIVTGQLAQSLSMTKTAVVNEYSQNGKITYAISILNSGTTDFTNLTLTDNLGAYSVAGTTVYPLTFTEGSILYFVNGAVQSAPTVSDTEPLTVTGLNIPASGSAIIIYEVTANEFAPLEEGASITNTANLVSLGLEETQAQETITVVNGANLTIIKTLNPETVTGGHSITYTFIIENSGNEVAEGDVVLNDIFDPVLNDIAVEYDGAAWSEGVNYTYNEATGVFATLAGEISVPAAVFAQNPTTGEVSVTPGEVVITVTGTI